MQLQSPLSGGPIIAALKTAGVEFVVAVPDIWTSHGLLWPVSRDPELRLVRLCKEDEGISICSGLAYAGRRAVLMMQCTGFLDSTNALQQIAINYQRPVCMIVGLLGKKPGVHPRDAQEGSVRLTQAVVDATGIAHLQIETGEDIARLAPAIDNAYATSRPFVALVGQTVQP